MMSSQKILFVFDSLPGGARALQVESSDIAIICPMTFDQAIVDKVKKDIKSHGVEIKEVNFPSRFNETAFSVKEDYLKFIAEFPEREISGINNLKEHFISENFSLWWFSLVAEKSTLKTTSFHRLVQFLTLKRIAEEFGIDEIRVTLKDRDVTFTLKEYAATQDIIFEDSKGHKRRSRLFPLISNFKKTLIYSSYFFFKLLIIKLTMVGTKTRSKTLEHSRYILVNYFPFADDGLLKDKKFEDKYYAPFQRSLEKKYTGSYTWLSIIANTKELGLRGCIGLGKKINSWDETLYFLEEWIGFRDLLDIFVVYWRSTLGFLRILSRLSREFVYPESDTNLWHIYEDEWYSSFSGWTLVEGMAFQRAFNNAFERVNPETVIIYPAEMQAWEKALNIAARENGLRTVGFQHTIVPVMLLNYFNHPSELKEGDYISKMPRPHLLACVGDVTKKLFLESGWDESRVFAWGAIRFQQYVKALEEKHPWHERDDYVVVALSYSKTESIELIEYIYQAFKGQDQYRVLLKGHPVQPVEPMVSALGITLDENIFQIVETPLGDLMPKARAMIVTESSSALEGFANQCPVIVPLLAHTIDMNPLSGITDLVVHTSTPSDLQETVDGLISAEDAPISYEKYKTFIEEYCKFPPSDDVYLQILEEKLETF